MIIYKLYNVVRNFSFQGKKMRNNNGIVLEAENWT